jgi:hypothetical protein
MAITVLVDAWRQGEGLSFPNITRHARHINKLQLFSLTSSMLVDRLSADNRIAFPRRTA